MIDALKSHKNRRGKFSPQALVQNPIGVPSFSPAVGRGLARRNNVKAAAAYPGLQSSKAENSMSCAGGMSRSPAFSSERAGRAQRYLGQQSCPYQRQINASYGKPRQAKAGNSQKKFMPYLPSLKCRFIGLFRQNPHFPGAWPLINSVMTTFFHIGWSLDLLQSRAVALRRRVALGCWCLELGPLMACFKPKLASFSVTLCCSTLPFVILCYPPSPPPPFSWGSLGACWLSARTGQTVSKIHAPCPDIGRILVVSVKHYHQGSSSRADA
jgi:hypothetical protein